MGNSCFLSTLSDVMRPLRDLMCDSIQSGHGAALTQNGHSITYASRALTETES